MTTPLFITRDEDLLDEVLRLCAAAGVTPELAQEPTLALRAWDGAPLVLVGVDVAEEMAALLPPRRPGVHLIACRPVSDLTFRTALEVGAEGVVELPQSAGWVVESLTDAGDPPTPKATTIAVLAGSGGAGASTFACALGQLAARSGWTMLVDFDPLGAGLDRMLGLEDSDGVRWDGLQRTTGRLSARSVRDAVPRRGRLGVLTWGAGRRGSVQPFAAREALSAAQRGNATVVVDLPRSQEPLVEEIAARGDLLVVVAVPTMVGLAAAGRLCARFAESTRVGLVLRGSGRAVADLRQLVGVPAAVTMLDQRGLEESLDLGLGPVRSSRGPLARAAGEVLERVAAGGVW